jgi:hypothetical protein
MNFISANKNPGVGVLKMMQNIKLFLFQCDNRF